ncbi:MAG: pentapeptide repeat-containing protein [Rivularia sp. (in: cyanobacteria)]
MLLISVVLPLMASLRLLTSPEPILEGATSYKSNLEGALMVDTNLRNAQLLQTPFTGVDLSNADLTGALNASLQGAILYNTTMPDGSIASNNSIHQ